MCTVSHDCSWWMIRVISHNQSPPVKLFFFNLLDKKRKTDQKEKKINFWSCPFDFLNKMCNLKLSIVFCTLPSLLISKHLWSYNWTPFFSNSLFSTLTFPLTQTSCQNRKLIYYVNVLTAVWFTLLWELLLSLKALCSPKLISDMAQVISWAITFHSLGRFIETVRGILIKLF